VIEYIGFTLPLIPSLRARGSIMKKSYKKRIHIFFLDPCLRRDDREYGLLD